MENQHQPTTAKPKKNSYSAGIKLAALICLVLFFFPLCTVSCSFDGNTYTDDLNGWDCATGTEVFDGEGEIEAHPFSFMLLIIPASLFILAVICRSKISPIAMVLGIAHIVALLIFRNTVIDYVEAEGSGMIDLSFTAWYTADMVSAVVASILGLLGIVNVFRSSNCDLHKKDE